MADPKTAQTSDDSQEPPRRLIERFSTAGSRGSGTGLVNYAAAGLCSGFVSSLILHPLDVVQTRLQVHDGKMTHLPRYRGTAHALAKIFRDDGPAALYSGLAPNLIGQTVSWGCFFWTHAQLKSILRGMKEDQFVKDGQGVYRPQLTLGERLGCSAGAGVVTATVTQPIWVIKTRLQLQTPSAKHYTGMLDVARRIGAEEGWQGLWRGLAPSLCLVSNIAIQMLLYEEFRARLKAYMGRRAAAGGVERRRHTLERWHGWHSFVCGAAAKVCASCSTYPLMVVRTRLQQRDPALLPPAAPAPAPPSRHYAGVLDVVRKTVAGEGVAGLYKGLGTNLARVVPGAAITFSVYEYVKNNL